MLNRKRIRVGLVGVGSWGRYGHIPALRLLPEYEIVAVSSRKQETAAKLAAEFGIPYAFDDFQELADHPEVDLVVVLPPAPEHVRVVRTAIAAGKDVYCEWPLTTNTADSEELLRLAENASVRHFVGLQRTVGASSLQLKDLIQSGFVGKLRSVRMHVSMNGFGPVRSKSLDWTLPAANFSHVLSIYGGHFMDMLFHAVGQPTTLASLLQVQFPTLSVEAGSETPNETPDAVMVMGTLQDGALFQIQIEGGKLHPKGLQIEITGTRGDVEITNERAFVTKHHDLIRGVGKSADAWQPIEIRDEFRTVPSSELDVSVQDLAQLYTAFARDRSLGTKSVRDFTHAVALHRLIDAVVDTASTKHGVMVQSFGSLNLNDTTREGEGRMSNMSLAGKRALVTGASRGIGAAIAKALAAEGADIAITYEKSAEAAQAVVAAIQATGRHAVAIQADSAEATAIQTSIDQTVTELGGLDILVNNAGILRLGPVSDISLEDVDALLNVNVRAVILASKAAIPHLGKGGRIINIGSFFADKVPGGAGLTVYALTKSALTAFSQGLARELGPKDITVNVVQPGSIDTEMNPAHGPFGEILRSITALGRYGKVEEVADLVTFLAGQKAQYITGTTITVDGGANA